MFNNKKIGIKLSAFFIESTGIMYSCSYQPWASVWEDVENVERYPADEESAAHKYQQLLRPLQTGYVLHNELTWTRVCQLIGFVI